MSIKLWCLNNSPHQATIFGTTTLAPSQVIPLLHSQCLSKAKALLLVPSAGYMWIWLHFAHFCPFCHFPLDFDKSVRHTADCCAASRAKTSLVWVSEWFHPTPDWMMPQSPRWRCPAPSSWRRRSPCTRSSCTRAERSSYTSSPPSTRPTRSSTPRGSESHGEVATCSSFWLLFFNSFRTNVSLGSDELFYKGASPFQYNLDSRNISLIEVSNS